MCGRQYPYELVAGNKDRGILITFDNYEVCRACVKKIKQFICQIKSQ